MKTTTFLFLMLCSALGFAQNSIPNADFENWTTVSYDNLDGYLSENVNNLSLVGSALTIKSTDAYQGNYSLRMETQANGSDTLYGYITSGQFGLSNGVAYSQTPDSIVGYFKCDVQQGDSAGIVLIFSNSGIAISYDTYPFVGTQNNWTRFAFPINLAATPDSVFIGAASSNAINEIGITPGSWLMLDSVHFVGSGITQQLPNMDFENWTNFSFEDPDSWSTANVFTSADTVYSATKTMDSYSQSYALRLENIASTNQFSGLATNGYFGSSNFLLGGQPFSSTVDTLVGHYKFLPSGVDSAGMLLVFYQAGNLFSLSLEYFPPSPTYTPFEIPFSLLQTPDTMRIDISSSSNDSIGSVLYVDGLALKSILTSLDDKNKLVEGLSVYPNPAINQLNVKWKKSNSTNLTIELIDGLGRVYSRQESLANSAEEVLQFGLEGLSSGIYFLRFKGGEGELFHRRFIKQ